MLDTLGETIGAADDECDVERAVAPVAKTFREARGGPALAALVERDRMAASGCRRNPLRLGGEYLRHASAAIAWLGFDLDQLERKLARQSAHVVVDTGGDPFGHAMAKRDDADFHLDAEGSSADEQ